jgi:hypothetical protein
MRRDSLYFRYMKVRRHALTLAKQTGRRTGTGTVITPARALKMVLERVFPELEALSSPDVFVLHDRSTGEYVVDPVTGRPITGKLNRQRLDRAFVSKLLGRRLRAKEAVVLEFTPTIHGA